MIRYKQEQIVEEFPVKIIPNIAYATPNGSLQLLDLYLPQGIEGALPVIIWLHGGGWRVGDRKLAPDLSCYFAKLGFAMVSIDYRLSGEALFPAQIHDVKTAIRWVRETADQYGFDRERIGLWDSSAGGHLAALAGVTEGNVLEGENKEYENQSSHVQTVVVGYGPTDFLQMETIVTRKASRLMIPSPFSFFQMQGVTIQIPLNLCCLVPLFAPARSVFRKQIQLHMSNLGHLHF